MSTHLNPSDPTTGERRTLSVEVPPVIADRVDNLAAYCGTNRSGFLRLSVALADMTTTLGELRRQAEASPDDAEIAANRDRVAGDLAQLVARLGPPSPPPMLLSDN